MLDLRICGIQTELTWENPQENIDRFIKIISELPDDINLVLLPEMFTTGFSMKPEKLAHSDVTTDLSDLLNVCKQKDVHLIGSVMTEDSGGYFNRLIHVNANGVIANHYDKRHLFSLAGEEKVYTSGNANIQIEIKGWKIRPLVCYDLRFPVWCRNDTDYDLLVFVANWPEKRIAHWRQLLIARAIENQSFTVGLNRVGEDGNDYVFNGNSMIVSPSGEVLRESIGKTENIIETLKYSEIQEFRKYLSALEDKDDFQINT